jgi:hypothetical protein
VSCRLLRRLSLSFSYPSHLLATMHASQALFLAALAAAANAAPPTPLADLPKLPALPKVPGPSDLPKPPTPPSPPKTPGEEVDEEEATTCTYDGKDDGKFDYSAVSLREVGARNTLDWRIWLLHKCKPISFWHDVRLPCTHTHLVMIKLAHLRFRSLFTHTKTTPKSSTELLRFHAGPMARSRSRAKSL